jgi:hypothetical protein
MTDLITFRNEKLWRWLTNFWTLVFMVLLTANFFSADRYDFLVAPFSVVYIGILTLYVGTKEFDRWYDLHESRHPGELFVIAWTIVIFALMVLSVVLQNGYKVSSEAIAVYIMVLSVFALTQKSKRLHQRKRGYRR